MRLAFVQNRCCAALGWDADVRGLCTREGVAYQGFSLLTGNEGLSAAHWSTASTGAPPGR